MQPQETVTVQRDVIAVRVPQGDQVILKEGANVTIMQALGGSFTLQTQGRLYRLDGEQADAIGKEPLQGPELDEDCSDAEVEQLVWEQMKSCYDPEIPINIVDLGLIYRCDIRHTPQGRQVAIDMTLTAPGCGMGDVIADDVRYKVLRVPTVADCQVNVVFDPPWHTGMMSEYARLQTGMF